MGMGRGRRFRNPGIWGFRDYPVPPAVPYGYPPQNEEQILADEAAFLEGELGRIRERLGELEKARAGGKTEAEKNEE